MATINICRGSDLNIIHTLPLSEDFVFSKALMVDHTITAKIDRLTALSVQINDYIKYKGVIYNLNFVPDAVTTEYLQYNLSFEGPEYLLYDKLVRHLKTASFPYYGDAEAQIDLVLSNINQIHPGFTKGTIAATDPEFVQYENFDCRTAITKIAEQFKLEIDYVNRQINLVKKVGVSTTYIFDYGYQNGLYSISRKSVKDDNVKTRIFGFGGTRNLPKNYRGGAANLIFQDEYKENNIALYGEKEGQYTNEEIYPKREAPITGVGAITDTAEIFTVTDSTLNFNVNDYLLATEAKVSFLSGEMLGEEFTVLSYNNSTKTFTLKTKVNAANIKLPTTNFKPVIGDKMALLDMSLPIEYLQAAEADLEAETLAKVLESSIPNVELTLDFDPLYLSTYGITLNPGDEVQLINSNLGINSIIRVASVNYPLTFPGSLTNNTKYTVTLSNTVNYGTQVRTVLQQINTQVTTKVIKNNAIAESKRNAYNMRILEGSIFDTDGLFDTDKINIGVLSAALAIVGVKSQNFVLNGVYLTDNYLADPNRVVISGGQLIHLEYANSGGDVWTMGALDQSGLNPSKFYYIYAVIAKNSQVGYWLINENQIKVDDIANNYTLLAGIVFPVNQGLRDTEFTYGITTITGARIKSGIIEGRNNALSINLETGAITGDVTFKGSSLANINGISSNASNALTNAATAQTTANNAYTVGTNAANAAAAVQSNLSTLQNGLGGLAYKNAVALAQLDETIVQGGYIKTSLIETNALIISGGLATQTYAVNQASSYSASALNSAQTYANNVSTTAANNALSAAQTYAVQQINALQIGGQNLLSDGNFERSVITSINDSGGGGSFIGSSSPSFIPMLPGSTRALIIDGSGDRYVALTSTNINNVIAGKIYTISFDFVFAGTITSSSSYIFYSNNIEPIVIDFSKPQAVWNKNEFSFTALETGIVYLRFGFRSNSYSWIGFDNIKLEEGSKATAYSLSIGDIQSQLTNANAYTDTKATATINAAQSYADSVATSKANIAQTAAISSASADATAKANAAQSAAVSASQSLINSIQIGGVNLLNLSIEKSVFNATTNENYIIYNFENKIVAGTEYTLSWEYITSSNFIASEVFFLPNIGDLRLVSSGLVATNNVWTRVIATFTTSNNYTGTSAGYIRFDHNGSINGANCLLGVRYPKLEKGNKATDYSPSISDVDASIATAQTTAQNAVNAYNTLTSQLKATAFQDIEQWAYQGTTIVSGGYITASLLNVGYIQANVVTAGYINALDIVSKNIRTAESGTKRVEITQATNSIRVIAANNEILVDIDDDAALERFALIGGVPTAIYGPGVRVGLANADSSSLSRMGFATTAAGVQQHYIGQGTGGGGSVSLDAGYAFRINNLLDPSSGPGAKKNVELYLNYAADSFGGQILVLAAELV